MKKSTDSGSSDGFSARTDTGGNNAQLEQPALAARSPVAALEPSKAYRPVPTLEVDSNERLRQVDKSDGSASRRALSCDVPVPSPVSNNILYDATHESIVDDLLNLIGPAVILDWQRRSKGDARRWKHRTLDSQTAKRMAELRRHAEEGGNLGVALGEVSHGLCAIDFDTEPEVEEFLSHNPTLRTSLCTRGSRGCQIWVRILGALPNSADLQDGSDGRKVAEWRANGRQSIIHGVHPNGNPYQRLVNKPPKMMRYKEIDWPSTWLFPKSRSNTSTIQNARHTEEVPLYGSVSVCESPCQSGSVRKQARILTASWQSASKPSALGRVHNTFEADGE